jgi:para-nitrobenzyl esterase
LDELLRELGILKADYGKLQELPWEQIVAAQSKMEFRARRAPGGRRGFVPTAGTAELPKNPIEAVASGSAPLPVMIGCTQHEAALFLAAGGMRAEKVTEEILNQRMVGMFAGKAEAALEGYRANHPDYSPGDLLVRAMSDRTRMSGIDLAEAHIKAGNGATYMYLFTWQSPVLPHLKAAHGIDGAFYFDNTDVIPITSGNRDAKLIGARASAAWTGFARSGNPSSRGLSWPEYTLEKRETMIWNAPPKLASDPLKEDRALRARLAAS